MKAAALWLIVAGLVGAGGVTESGPSARIQVDSITRQIASLNRQVANLTLQTRGLQTQLYATQDSLSHLWKKTVEFVHAWAFDTIIPPPRCPPNCPRSEFAAGFPPDPRWVRADSAAR